MSSNAFTSFDRAARWVNIPVLRPDSLEEKQVLCSTEVYRQIYQQWEGLDTALVNIGDYPSLPKLEGQFGELQMLSIVQQGLHQL